MKWFPVRKKEPERVPENAPSPLPGRGELTGRRLDRLSSLTRPFQGDPFFRMRPPLSQEAAELSLELAQTAYTLRLEPWKQARWSDFSIQIDNELYCGVGSDAGGDRLQAAADAWKLNRARAALNSRNLAAQVLGALRQREKSDALKAVCMARPLEDGRVLLAVSFMGTGRRLYDWIPNLRFSTEEGFHRGFSQLCDCFEENLDRIRFPATARARGLERLSLRDALLDMRSLRSPYRLWTAGHSQGGAVMQLFTHRLIHRYGVQQQNLFGCGFASPTTATGRLLVDPASYPLYHLINQDDVVPRMGGLVHLGLCLEYPSDDPLRALYGLDPSGIDAPARERLLPYRDAMRDTCDALCCVYAMTAAYRSLVEEAEPGRRLEQQRMLGWLGRTLSFAGDKAGDWLDWILLRAREGYRDLRGEPMNEEELHRLIVEFREIFRDFSLRRVLGALLELGFPPHRLAGDDGDGAYAYIVKNGFSRLRPFIWRTRRKGLPERVYASRRERDEETHPPRSSRRPAPRRGRPYRGAARRSYSAKRQIFPSHS